MSNSTNRSFPGWTIPVWIVFALECANIIRKVFGWWSEVDFFFDKLKDRNIVIDFILSPHGQLIVMLVCMVILLYSFFSLRKRRVTTMVGHDNGSHIPTTPTATATTTVATRDLSEYLAGQPLGKAAIKAQARLARELRKHDPAVKAFNEARENDIRTGADIDEQPLGLVVYLIVTNSAWGRWQAAQHHVAVGDQQIIRVAESHVLEYLRKGRIATRGHRNGDSNYCEFISPDWWSRFYFRLDSTRIKAIYPRNGVDAAAHPSYAAICCEWPKVRAMFPIHDEQMDAITASILSS